MFPAKEIAYLSVAVLVIASAAWLWYRVAGAGAFEILPPEAETGKAAIGNSGPSVGRVALSPVDVPPPASNGLNVTNPRGPGQVPVTGLPVATPLAPLPLVQHVADGCDAGGQPPADDLMPEQIPPQGAGITVEAEVSGHFFKIVRIRLGGLGAE